jgi:manganese-dependent inorganic pyrophosphatase
VAARLINELHEGEDIIATAVFLWLPNQETKHVFAKVGLTIPAPISELPEGSHIVLVDHNEAGQSIPDRERYTIDMVIDHHKVADFKTSAPVSMRLDPVACTCTILAEMMLEHIVVPPAGIAELMIAAIMSDTLYWRSSTTTQRDKDAVSWLNEIARIHNLEEFSDEMFEAKSDLWDIDAKSLVMMDYKTFDFGGNAMGIWVMETTNPGYAFDRRDEIIDAIHDIKEEQWLEQLLFCVVDIIKSKNTAFVVSEREEEIVSWAFGAYVDDEWYADLGDRISRKKTIVPPIDDWFGEE